MRHLRFFSAVAEHRHFGHAASALGMTQPPVSQGIQRLEAHLGQRLFDRDARGVRLTAAGDALLPRARALLEAADELISSAHRWRPHTRFRLGLAGDLEDAVPSILTGLAAGGWDLEPTIAGTVNLVSCLRGEELDAAVIRHPAVVDGLRAGEVISLATRIVPPQPPGARLRDQALPLVVAPRSHHPAVHDQLVDSLRRAGHSGAVLQAGTETERRAWAAAGQGWRLALGGEAGRSPEGLPPFRVRVVTPTPADRRVGLDHDAVVAALEELLRGQR